MKTFAVFLLTLSGSIIIGSSFATNYEQNLQLAISTIKTAKSLEEVANSPFDPTKVFSQIARQPVDDKKLCQALLALPAEDLALLEQYIDSYQTRLQLSCYQTLTDKISIYHQIKARAFFQLVQKDRAYEGMSSWSPLKTIAAIGPKEPSFYKGAIPVDARQGTVVYQRDLVTGELNTLNLQRGDILLTFDDGPHPSRTLNIANILEDHQIKALFFALGEKAKAQPSILKTLIRKGNVYGSHSNSHAQLSKLPYDQAIEEIKQGHINVVKASNHEDSGFFRFPYGSRTTELAKFLKANSLSSFFWNMDTLDWKYTDPVILHNHIIDEINREQKGILLFHDIHQQTLTVLDTILEKLHQAGYNIRLAVPTEWMEAQ